MGTSKDIKECNSGMHKIWNPFFTKTKTIGHDWFSISIFALIKGYAVHKTIVAVPIALFGLSCLVVAVILGEAILGEAGEKGLTALGSVFVATAHYKNYQICKNSHCSCHEK